MVEEPGGGEMNGAEQVGVEEYGLSLGQSLGQCVEGRGEVTQLFGGELGVVFELIDDGADKGFLVNVGALFVPARLAGVVVFVRFRGAGDSLYRVGARCAGGK